MLYGESKPAGSCGHFKFHTKRDATPARVIVETCAEAFAVAGSSALRWTLVQAAWATLRSRAAASPLRSWALQLAQRRGKRIAVVAVARKLAGILYALWRDGTTYDPRVGYFLHPHSPRLLRRPPVVVMQAIDDWDCHDTTVNLGHSRHRLFLPEALVWPSLVVEAGVLRDEAQKLALAKHENMVEQFAPESADKALGEGVGPSCRADEQDAAGSAGQGAALARRLDDEAGNAFLREFMEDYNRRFGRTPRNGHDAHRPLRDDEDLSRIFTWQEERTMSRNLVVHFQRVTYLVEPGPETLPFAGKRVRVFERMDSAR